MFPLSKGLFSSEEGKAKLKLTVEVEVKVAAVPLHSIHLGSLLRIEIRGEKFCFFFVDERGKPIQISEAERKC